MVGSRRDGGQTRRLASRQPTPCEAARAHRGPRCWRPSPRCCRRTPCPPGRPASACRPWCCECACCCGSEDECKGGAVGGGRQERRRRRRRQVCGCCSGAACRHAPTLWWHRTHRVEPQQEAGKWEGLRLALWLWGSSVDVSTDVGTVPSRALGAPIWPCRALRELGEEGGWPGNSPGSIKCRLHSPTSTSASPCTRPAPSKPRTQPPACPSRLILSNRPA